MLLLSPCCYRHRSHCRRRHYCRRYIYILMWQDDIYYFFSFVFDIFLIHISSMCLVYVEEKPQ